MFPRLVRWRHDKRQGQLSVSGRIAKELHNATHNRRRAEAQCNPGGALW